MKYFWRVYRSDGLTDDVESEDCRVNDGTLEFSSGYLLDVVMAPGTWLRVLRVVEVEEE